jgi:secreted trypsin-like serine protease
MHLFRHLILSSSLVLACNTNPQASQPLIVDGKDADGPVYPTVSLQKSDSTGVMFSFCTGVLLAQRFVLTAAHCSVSSETAKVTALDAEAVKVVAYDSRPERPEAIRLSVAKIQFVSTYSPLAMQRNSKGLIVPENAGDLAIWTLAEDAPSGILAEILPKDQVDQVLLDQTKIIIMGFGKRSSWDSPWLEHTLAMSETPFFETVEMTETKTVIEDGRSKRKSFTHKVPGKTDTEFFAGGRNLPDTCKGDSGGPAFVKNPDGKLKLIGITSRGASGCDQGGVYTLVPAYASWIESVTGISLVP